MKIVLANISKRFGSRLLFENINIELHSGQCLAITGDNGTGKSTLLKIISGLTRPATGSIAIHYNNLSNINNRPKFGLVSPDMAMYKALTAIENITFWSKLLGLSITESQAKELCGTVGLAGSEYKQLSTYSTGMFQRLKLATIMAVNPLVWLLDEPSSNLDESGKQIVKDVINRAVNSNSAVFLATNEAKEAEYANFKIKL
ncbi:ABC transporter ATP-binding protein [Dendrosporobacter sp. 1207_IL3150]|uniref:ABC transporter ATP-binding protein n=1 Tax=Dendrosporobacter sp. 1207_IL3150 TaxID=3084054 RepID=UPI002FDADB24